jgi:hypothetical protein
LLKKKIDRKKEKEKERKKNIEYHWKRVLVRKYLFLEVAVDCSRQDHHEAGQVGQD